MELRLTLFGVKRSIDLSRFARYRNAIVVLASALLVVPDPFSSAACRRAGPGPW
jgi:hypothetical protein